MDKNYSNYTHNGNNVPRISSIIKLLAKDSLILWSNYLGFKRMDYKKVIELEASIGTMIHDYIEDYLPTNRKDLKLEYFNFYKYGIFSEGDKIKAINGIRSFQKFYQKNKDLYKLVQREITLTNKLMGGTIDAVIESPFNKNHVVLMDYKTSGDFYITHFLQLVGYVLLYRDNFPNVKIDGIMVLLMDKKKGNKARSRYYSIDDIEPFLNIFMSLLEVHKNLEVIESVQCNDNIFR